MGRTIAFGAAISQGTWPCQEDGFLADPTRRLFAVADGFGGRGAGDMATKLALAALRAPTVDNLTNGETPTFSRLRGSFLTGNKQILERNAARPPAARGGASLLAAQVSAEGDASVIHTGACSAFLVKAGTLFPVLLGQSAPRQESLSLLPDHALGFGEALQLEARQFRLRPGEIFFLVSGGLDWETEAFRSALFSALLVREPASSLEALARQLIEEASLPSQGWNRTLLALEMP
jgi:serine/threonine protein phosphatase PrpC